jgi:hypothetical protein
MDTLDLMVSEIAELRMALARQKIVTGRLRLALTNVVDESFKNLKPGGTIYAGHLFALDILEELDGNQG